MRATQEEWRRNPGCGCPCTQPTGAGLSQSEERERETHQEPDTVRVVWVFEVLVAISVSTHTLTKLNVTKLTSKYYGSNMTMRDTHCVGLDNCSLPTISLHTFIPLNEEV